jgi:SAM-dependent methyltransferases related to tRNA (uracil-5-)-methyltransferase
MVSEHVEKKICVISNEPSALATKWSEFLKAPLNPANPDQFFFRMEVQNEELLVRDQENRKLEIDFDKNHLDYERRGHRGKNELIAKALGLGKGCERVLDLSVGMAIDSIFLTQLGFKVIGVERSPVLFALLTEAFARTQKEYLKDYQLYFDDSLNFLKTKKSEIAVDSIYFDPMYPHKKKSALPKQEMMVFRDLVGSDADASEVLREALTWNVKRVVVKRPMQAEELLPGVRHSFEGKVVRYDTYVVG